MGGNERAKPKVPLDEEWAALARKMLKGADPEERLTWRTPEVCEGEGSSSLTTLRILQQLSIYVRIYILPLCTRKRRNHLLYNSQL